MATFFKKRLGFVLRCSACNCWGAGNPDDLDHIRWDGILYIRSVKMGIYIDGRGFWKLLFPLRKNSLKTARFKTSTAVSLQKSLESVQGLVSAVFAASVFLACYDWLPNKYLEKTCIHPDAVILLKVKSSADSAKMPSHVKHL